MSQNIRHLLMAMVNERQKMKTDEGKDHLFNSFH